MRSLQLLNSSIGNLHRYRRITRPCFVSFQVKVGQLPFDDMRVAAIVADWQFLAPNVFQQRLIPSAPLALCHNRRCTPRGRVRIGCPKNCPRIVKSTTPNRKLSVGLYRLALSTDGGGSPIPHLPLGGHQDRAVRQTCQEEGREWQVAVSQVEA
jgi:hypothetical protein